MGGIFIYISLCVVLIAIVVRLFICIPLTAGADVLRDASIVTRLYCLHRRLSAATVQQPHWAALSEAARHVRRLWESAAGREALLRCALSLRDWLAFEVAHPLDETTLDAIQVFAFCVSVCSFC